MWPLTTLRLTHWLWLFIASALGLTYRSRRLTRLRAGRGVGTAAEPRIARDAAWAALLRARWAGDARLAKGAAGLAPPSRVVYHAEEEEHASGPGLVPSGVAAATWPTGRGGDVAYGSRRRRGRGVSCGS